MNSSTLGHPYTAPRPPIGHTSQSGDVQNARALRAMKRSLAFPNLKLLHAEHPPHRTLAEPQDIDIATHNSEVGNKTCQRSAGAPLAFTVEHITPLCRNQPLSRGRFWSTPPEPSAVPLTQRQIVAALAAVAVPPLRIACNLFLPPIPSPPSRRG